MQIPKGLISELIRTNRLFEELSFNVAAKDEAMNKKWYTQDGRVLEVSEMGLDHLINSWHMMALMTATMRKQGSEALGGLHNRNLNPATVKAFTEVHPGDVFPLYDHIVMYSQAKFAEKFGLELRDCKRKIFEAWDSTDPQHAIEPHYEPAIRFLLRADKRLGAVPTISRVRHMLTMARIETDAQFQRVCWNLRYDQPIVWQFITTHNMTSLVRRIPHNRLRTALRFKSESYVLRLKDCDDMPFDVDGGAGDLAYSYFGDKFA